MQITVCIPTYNGEKYIKEQLLSILNQLAIDDEIIISDDSSSDNTLKVIENINDKRIKILKNCSFRSPIFNLENALNNANGDYIFLADQDDIWLPDKVSTIMPYFVYNDLIISDCYIINDKGKIINESFFKIVNSKSGFLKNFIKNSYLGCCMAFNRKILEYVLPFPKNIAMHDIWIGLNAEIISNPCFIQEKLIYYRRHGANISLASEISNNTYWYRIKYRLDFLVNLLQRFLKKKIIK